MLSNVNSCMERELSHMSTEDNTMAAQVDAAFAEQLVDRDDLTPAATVVEVFVRAGHVYLHGDRENAEDNLDQHIASSNHATAATLELCVGGAMVIAELLKDWCGGDGIAVELSVAGNDLTRTALRLCNAAIADEHTQMAELLHEYHESNGPFGLRRLLAGLVELFVVLRCEIAADES